MERVMGIEPTYAAWKAAVLPLNYTRMCSRTVLQPANHSLPLRLVNPSHVELNAPYAPC
jgi:hypothetical protein